MRSIIFLSLLLFAACSADKKGTIAVQEPVKDGVLTDTAAVADSLMIFKGLYTYGEEINTFRDCSNKVYWVNDSLKSLSSEYLKAKGALSYPYESVYAEVKGYLKGKSTTGYASEYESVLVVTDIIEIRQKNYASPCVRYDFIALGNEPFWSLDILPDEKLAALKDVAANKSYTFPYTPPKISGPKITYTFENDLNETLEVIITRQKCNDGMSDRKYEYTAEVTINGNVLSGCAIKKGDKL